MDYVLNSPKRIAHDYRPSQFLCIIHTITTSRKELAGGSCSTVVKALDNNCESYTDDQHRTDLNPGNDSILRSAL